MKKLKCFFGFHKLDFYRYKYGHFQPHYRCRNCSFEHSRPFSGFGNMIVKILILTMLAYFVVAISSCNPCKRISRLAEKNPQCLENITEKITVYDTIQGDTVKFWAQIEIDTAKLMDSIRLILQTKDSTGELHLSPLLKIIPKAMKIEPFYERTEDYYAMAYVEDGILKVFVETFPKFIEKTVEVEVYKLPEKKKWVSGSNLFLIGLAIGIFLMSLFIGFKK